MCTSSLCGSCGAWSGYVQASSASSDALQCNLAAALWEERTQGRSLWDVRPWEWAREPPRSRQLRDVLGWGVFSALRLPGARHRVAGEGRLMVLLQYRVLFCHSCVVWWLLQVEFSIWRQEWICMCVGICLLSKVLSMHFFFLSLVNDRTSFGFGNENKSVQPWQQMKLEIWKFRYW